ncbi:MAG: YciI family protein [Pseudomonadota bacterium]
MPLFIVSGRDKPGSTDLRQANRPAHLEWAKTRLDRMICGGPVIAPDGEAMIGSTFLVNFDSLEDAKAWAAEDPYAKAGLFDRVEVIEYKWLLGEAKPI